MAIRLAKIVQCAASILIFSLARDGEPTSLAIALFAPSSYSQFPFSCFLPAPEFRVVLLPTRATWIFNSAISCSLKSQSTANVLVAWWFARFAEAAVTRVRALVFAPGHAPTNNFRYSQHVVPERERVTSLSPTKSAELVFPLACKISCSNRPVGARLTCKVAMSIPVHCGSMAMLTESLPPQAPAPERFPFIVPNL